VRPEESQLRQRAPACWRAHLAAWSLASLVTIAACGGGGSLPATLTAAARDPASAGKWSSVLPFPAVPIHVSLLPNQRVIFWGTGHMGTVLFDPRDGTCSAGTPSDHVLFCCGHSFLGDGRLFIVGGHAHEHEAGLPPRSRTTPSRTR
jgi:hypothetical protein